MPVRRSERRAGLVNRARSVQLRRRAPIFQAVRSGILRLISARLSVRVRSSPTSRGGSSMVEHVKRPVRFSPGFTFLGSEGEDTSLEIESRAVVRAMAANTSARHPRKRTREGLQGTSPVFSQKTFVGGSEDTVASVRAAPLRRRRSLVRFQPAFFMRR